MLAWEDECWFSRLAQPSLKAWSREGKPLALEQKEQSQEDQEAKAVACYGAVEEGTGQVRLRFSPGQPNSGSTLEFLKARMTKLPNQRAGDNIGKNLRGICHVVTPAFQG